MHVLPIYHVADCAGLEAKLNTKHEPVRDRADAGSPDDAELTEDRMRRALGLDRSGSTLTLPTKNAPSRPATIRVQASNPPNQRASSAERTGTRPDAALPLRQRITELEHQLTVERQRHEEARRLLQQAELTARNLEARFQQKASAQQEELEAERRAIVTAQQPLDEALFESQPRDQATRIARAEMAVGELPTAKRLAARVAAPPKRSPPTAVSSVGALAEPKKLGRPRTHSMPEPKPVRWWTLSYRAKTKT